MSEEEATERVTQLWPASLKAQVQEIVGPRGVTKFTLEAVRAKLGQQPNPQAEAEATVAEALGEPIEAVHVEHDRTPVAVVERQDPTVAERREEIAAAAVERESKLIEGETRGAGIDVVTTSTGASELYNSSQARVQAMLDKAAQMGVKKAVDLPVPPKPVLTEVVVPDQVEEAPEEPFTEETPEEYPTLQETLRQVNATKIEPTTPASALEPTPTAPAPIQTPVRNLDDIDVDF